MTDVVMRIDGSCYPNPGSMGIGVVIYQDEQLIKKISKYVGQGTNNIAEYIALLEGLNEIKKIKTGRITIYCDSQLVVKQLNGIYKVKDKKILDFYLKVQNEIRNIPGKIKIIWNGRENNSLADGLAKQAVMDEENRKRKIKSEELLVKKESNHYLVIDPTNKNINHVNLDLSACDCKEYNKKTQKIKIECSHILAVRNTIEKKVDREKQKKTIQAIKVLILSKMVTFQTWKKHFEDLNKKEKINLEIRHFEKNDSMQMQKYLSEAEVIIGNLKNRKDYQIAKSLKLIQIPYAGVDKIDFSFLKEHKDVFACNIHANKQAVAEHAISLMFALAKNTIRNDNDLRKGIWHGFASKESTIQLKGKKLGIIGLGAIGWQIAKFADCLGMKIVAIKREIAENDKEKKKLLKFLGEKNDLTKIIKESDFIILSVPLTKETNGLISKNEIELMKGKYLINISRGIIIDEKALYCALKDNLLAGAAIDTWYQYPNREKRQILPSQFNFHQLNNVILSPHTAGYTEEAVIENIRGIFKNIVRLYHGEKPENQINPDLGY